MLTRLFWNKTFFASKSAFTTDFCDLCGQIARQAYVQQVNWLVRRYSSVFGPGPLSDLLVGISMQTFFKILWNFAPLDCAATNSLQDNSPVQVSWEIREYSEAGPRDCFSFVSPPRSPDPNIIDKLCGEVNKRVDPTLAPLIFGLYWLLRNGLSGSPSPQSNWVHSMYRRLHSALENDGKLAKSAIVTFHLINYIRLYLFPGDCS